MPASFLTEPPAGETVTPYDRALCGTYLRLLDADAAGADWRVIANVIFHIDPISDPIRAEKVVTTHMQRAKWMSSEGFKKLAHLPEPTRTKTLRPSKAR